MEWIDELVKKARAQAENPMGKSISLGLRRACDVIQIRLTLDDVNSRNDDELRKLIIELEKQFPRRDVVLPFMRLKEL